MGIDPLTSLAFTVRANRGTYALLIGSGVSTGAGIPTGWAIVLDLVRQLALVEGETVADAGLEDWYTKRYGEAPTYSALLDRLARTPTERQSLIRRYIEPTNEERVDGLKVPTAAHRAIARLAAPGFVRVIVTTNFDRLLEQALDDAGVDHDVIASADAIAGARPIPHAPCLILKVHGDYRDARIRNTAGELERYEPKLERLLDRIVAEYGLIVCGWSAAWDSALRGALLRRGERRYAAYWTTRGPLTIEAQDLVKHLRADVIEIESADQFFPDLTDRLEALVEIDRPHPLTVGVAVATLKRYLPDPAQRIRLHDLVMGEAERVNRALGDEQFPPTDPGFTDATWRGYVLERLARYRSATESFVNLLAVGCAWSADTEQDALWGRALERVGNHGGTYSGTTMLIELRRYPALLSLYAGGIAAAREEKYGALRAMAVDQQYRELNETVPMVAGVHPWKTFSQEAVQQALHEGNQKRYTPISDHLHDMLREPLRQLIPSDAHYTDAFDKLEYLLGLILTDTRTDRDANDRYIVGPWIGSYVWRYRHERQHGPWLVIEKDLEDRGEQWPPLRAGLFDGSAERAREAVQSFGTAIKRQVSRFL